MAAKGYRLAGKVMFQLYNDDTGLLESKVYDGGNTTELTLQAEGEDVEILSTDYANPGAALDSMNDPKPTTGSWGINRFTAQTLAMACSANADAYSGAAVSGQTHTFTATEGVGELISDRPVESVVVSRAAGVDAADWSGSASITLGAYRVPTTPNGHFYKCTTAGTTSSSEPTWPTNGGTVTDGTVVWTDQGTIVAVLNTDYTLNTDLAVVTPLSTGAIATGDEIDVAFTQSAKSGYEILGSTALNKRIKLMLDGRNLFDNSKVRLIIDKLKLKPAGTMSWINTGNATAEQKYDFTCIVPDGQTAPYRLYVAE